MIPWRCLGSMSMTLSTLSRRSEICCIVHSYKIYYKCILSHMNADARLNRKFWAGSNVTARIAEISSTLAAAIEQQGAASQEIAGSAAAILRGGLGPEILRTEDQ